MAKSLMVADPAELAVNGDAGGASAAISGTLRNLISVARVESAFGTPLRRGRHMVVPAAEVVGMLGFGMGIGSGPSESGHESGAGSGGGGGGNALARPVAALEFGPDGVRVLPILDFTKVLLAALTATGFVAGMLYRMRRGPGT